VELDVPGQPAGDRDRADRGALTQVYQFVIGLSPLQAGLRALPPALMVAVVSPLGARVAQKSGPRAPIAAGLALATGGLICMRLRPRTPATCTTCSR